MKYTVILLVLTASILSAKAKLPDYINVCKRTDPQINKCVRSSILSMKDKLVEGIPELAVLPIDPLRLDKLVIDLGVGFKAEGRNLLITGAKEFQIANLDVDIKTNTYIFDVKIPEINATGDYEIDAMLGPLPIKGKGDINLVAKSFTARGTINGKEVVRGGKTLYWFPSLNLKIEVGDYTIKLGNLAQGDAVIGEATNQVLNDQKAEVLASLLPGLEKALSKHLLDTANNIVKHFTWDELFV